MNFFKYSIITSLYKYVFEWHFNFNLDLNPRVTIISMLNLMRTPR